MPSGKGESLTGPVKGRRAKIIGTIGPASRSEEGLAALLAAGLDVARLNMSHGTHEQHAAVIAAVRRWTRATDRSVAILLDLQGPKMRTGQRAGGGPVSLAARAPFTLTTRPVPGNARAVATTYADLPRDVTAGDTILLDDGLLELRVLATTATDVACRVVHGGVLDQHKGITLPGVALSAPALTPKDEADLAWVEQFPGYHEIFGPKGLPLVRQADTVITGAGVIVDGTTPMGISTGDLLEELLLQETPKLTKADLAKLVYGDIGGILLEKEGLTSNEKRQLEELNRGWTGAKADDLERIAKAASPEKHPGTILIASSPTKGDLVATAIRRGFINHGIFDRTLSERLKALARESRS